ncbi:hypothetical protein BC828DRAFT_374868 [Blastocladiella britannica]|nr:hypothetical protein BC828DRAFT_374868 [Blastocladiella britannica]
MLPWELTDRILFAALAPELHLATLDHNNPEHVDCPLVESLVRVASHHNLPRTTRAALQLFPHCSMERTVTSGRIDVLELRRQYLLLPSSTTPSRERQADLRWHATHAGHVHVLDWLERHCNDSLLRTADSAVVDGNEGSEMDLQQLMINSNEYRPLRTYVHDFKPLLVASMAGRPQVLSWWETRHVRDMTNLEPTICSVDEARACVTRAMLNDHIPVLEWWFVRFPQVFDQPMLKKAVRFKKTATIAWWISPRGPLSNIIMLTAANINALNFPASFMSLDVGAIIDLHRTIEGVLDSPLRDHAMLIEASIAGRADVLAGWIEYRGMPLKNAVAFAKSQKFRFIHIAADKGHVRVLAFWLSVLPRGSKSTLALACRQAVVTGQMRVFEWAMTHLGPKKLLPLLAKREMVADLVIRGRTHVLDVMRHHGHQLKYSHKLMEDVSSKGDVDTLAWLLEHTPGRLKYTERAVDKASQYGQLPVLQLWLRKSLENPERYPFRYSHDAIDKCMRVGILRWWKDSVLPHYPLEYTAAAVDSASAWANRAALNWWLSEHQSGGLPMMYTSHAVDGASASEQLKAVKWWLDHRDVLPLKCSAAALVIRGQPPVAGRQQRLQRWWQAQGIDPAKYGGEHEDDGPDYGRLLRF